MFTWPSKADDAGAEKCPIFMADIEVLFDQAQDGRYWSRARDRTVFDLYSGMLGVKEPFIKFCKAH